MLINKLNIDLNVSGSSESTQKPAVASQEEQKEEKPQRVKVLTTPSVRRIAAQFKVSKKTQYITLLT